MKISDLSDIFEGLVIIATAPVVVVILVNLANCAIFAPGTKPTSDASAISCEAQIGEGSYACVAVDCETGFASLTLGPCAEGVPACTDGITGCEDATR